MQSISIIPYINTPLNIFMSFAYQSDIAHKSSNIWNKKPHLIFYDKQSKFGLSEQNHSDATLNAYITETISV